MLFCLVADLRFWPLECFDAYVVTAIILIFILSLY